ncbi:helix-turn-helix domain-containing protein [Algoriphagus sp. H41]|uniref:Helix-turn-helix domain-containing protein n=1 Tax=Algoriphagus oliviformis TaxID=2811231 RepID=A0ABS3C9Y6_9BACT|nr:helix-turn-helix transcriptional regulator [Algoriphagus oliviformis]MBN7813359.1 helix-turn-helix domain-containing protein [Algoriphagus oliviformis]
MIYRGLLNEYLQLQQVHSKDCLTQTEALESPLTFLWFEGDDNQLIIDGVNRSFQNNEIVCLTEFHQADVTRVCKARMIRFNRSFYCIIDHDSEVGCKGVLFFGASQLPSFVIPADELEKFQTVWKMFELEMRSEDELQLEMLQSMLKRFIILCTRIYKQQEDFGKIDKLQMDLVREYNFLVEKNFRTVHTVAEYAAMLNKSPKTLSNLFSKISSKSPLQYIKERRLLEARRLLRHTDKSVKEIAYEIGFEDPQTFGRFFRNSLGVSPSEFKESH